MNLDLNRALHDLAQDGADLARIASPEALVGRRRRRRAVRRAAVGTVGLAVVGGLALAGTSLADHRADVPRPAATEPAPRPAPTATPTPTVASSEAPPSGDRPGARPLPDPYVSRWDGVSAISSDAPSGSGPLADGSYLAVVLAVDEPARTAVIDVGLFFGGADALSWAAENAPDMIDDGTLASDYVLLNEVERPRTVALAADAVLTGYCTGHDGQVQMRATTGAELASAPASDAECVARSTLTGNPPASWFWVDVRDGVVAQLVGQYLP